MTNPPELEFLDYDTRLAAYAVVVDEDDRVLLALWNEPDEPTWVLPGGGVELAETTAEGAVREVREETGYHVELGRVLGVTSSVTAPAERQIATDRWFKHVRVVYEATIRGGELSAEVDGSTDEARWFPRAQVAALRRDGLVERFVG